jgi:hypothetical protein
LAKIVLSFEDIPSPDDPTQVGVRFHVETDRTMDPAELQRFPATPAMLFALTITRLYHSGGVEPLIGFVCRDVMTNVGMSPQQIADAEAAGHKACE